MSRQQREGLHRCRCGSRTFIRRLSDHVSDTPCRIDAKSEVLLMDFASAGWPGEKTEVTFRCAKCAWPVPPRIVERIFDRYQMRTWKAKGRETA